MKKNYNRIVEVYKPTDDDWSCNFENNTVHLMYHGDIHDPKHPNGLYRVSVWGNGDIGMDRDFTEWKEAQEFFEKIKTLPVLNQKPLLALGFTWF